MIYHHYTEKEIDSILKTMTIIYDSREQQNTHILDYLHKKQVPFKKQKLDYGDYSAMIPANSDLNINRDIYLTSCIERKANVDEICVNLGKNERTRFENELIRAKGNPFVLLVEDLNGYSNILNGRYRSKYNPLALLATIKTFEARYGFTTYFTDKIFSGNYIYHHFYYQMKNYLKRGVF